MSPYPISRAGAARRFGNLAGDVSFEPAPKIRVVFGREGAQCALLFDDKGDVTGSKGSVVIYDTPFNRVPGRWLSHTQRPLCLRVPESSSSNLAS